MKKLNDMEAPCALLLSTNVTPVVGAQVDSHYCPSCLENMPTPCTPQEAAVLTESILSMIEKNMRPLALVEGAGFQKMLATFRSIFWNLDRF